MRCLPGEELPGDPLRALCAASSLHGLPHVRRPRALLSAGRSLGRLSSGFGAEVELPGWVWLIPRRIVWRAVWPSQLLVDRSSLLADREPP